jgi:hypothetical protein
MRSVRLARSEHADCCAEDGSQSHKISQNQPMVFGKTHEGRPLEPLVKDQPQNALKREDRGGRSVAPPCRYGCAEHEDEQRRGKEHRSRLRDIPSVIWAMPEPVAELITYEPWHRSFSMPSLIGPMMIP